ncbi:MAG: type II secretion system protein, partial [Burkholderiaceae bacterium]
PDRTSGSEAAHEQDMSKRRGFTLIELLVVIAIIGT